MFASLFLHTETTGAWIQSGRSGKRFAPGCHAGCSSGCLAGCSSGCHAGRSSGCLAGRSSGYRCSCGDQHPGVARVRVEVRSNHAGRLPPTSFGDAKVNRPVLFGVDPEYSLCEPWRSRLLTIGAITGCSMIPMQPGSSQGLRTMLRSLRSGSEGRSVCLFPKGGIDTPTDHDGARWLARTAGVPLMRVDLDHGPGARKIRWPSVRRYGWTSTLG
jgi:hypothetical protein